MTTEQRLSGIGASPLVGVGTVVWHRTDEFSLDDPPDPEVIDVDEEHRRFEDARDDARTELREERESARERVGEDEAAVLDAHIQFLNDPQVTTGVSNTIKEEKVPAEHAVTRVFAEQIEQFENMDGQIAERADDLRDVRDRVVRLLVGREQTDLGDLSSGSILLAKRLTPSDTVQLDADRVAGIATVTGGRTSHAAIIARSLAIPAIMGVGDELYDVADGTEIVIDGDAGEGIVDPDPSTRERADERSGTEIIHRRVETVDDCEIEVAANVGSVAEAVTAAKHGADGSGLFRSELLFLDRDEPPDEDEQRETYREVCEVFEGERVIIRTLDIGGDKPIPYLDLDEEVHSFLGDRGIRLSLGEHADLFETQLRALVRVAAKYDDLAVMFPMVSTVDELESAIDRLTEVRNRLESDGIPAAIPSIGVMIETPGAVFSARELAERVDFLSIGTNDLTQYVMAADRGNDHVADLYDPLQPAVLRAIDRTVEIAHEADAWVGVCGEMASDPDLTELLVGLGLDELSLSAVTVPAVKARVTETDTGTARDLAERALAAEHRADVTAMLNDT